MSIENIALAKKFFDKDIGKNSFFIGTLNIFEDEDFVVDVVDEYYEEIELIYLQILKEFKEKEDLARNEDSREKEFKFKVLSIIKKRFFPRWRDYSKVFNPKMEYLNDYFSELDCWAQSDNQRDLFVSEFKRTKEYYKKYVKYYANDKLKHLIMQDIPVPLNIEDLSSHSFTVGRSGSGKSVLILELAKNIIDTKSSSLVLIEPHGDLSEELASLVNKKDLVYIDPFLEKKFIPTINIFEIDDISIENISIYTGVIVDVFKQIIGGAFSPAMQSLLTPMVAVLLQLENSSFFDMLRFLDDSNNKELLRYAQENAINPSHRLYFKTQFLEKRASATKYSIATKLQVLLQDPIFANMLTGKSTIDLEKMINKKGKVIIIRLNTVKMTETIEPIGKFLTALITSYVFKREQINIENRVMTHFFIDEAPVFLSDSIATILEQARKFKLSLHLVSQNNHQLGTDINTSVLSNTSLKFVTINSNKNHKIMASEIGVSVDDLDALENKGQFFMKIGTKKAFQFQVFNRLIKTKDLNDSFLDSIKKEQLKLYYREVNLDDIVYVKIPNIMQDERKPYSMQVKKDLLSKIDNKVDDELLDY